MPYTKKQHGLIGAALGAKKSGKPAPAYVPSSMASLPTAKLSEMASAPTRKKVGKGDWGSTEKKSAGGSQTVVEKTEMRKGDDPVVVTTNHRGEEIDKMSGDCCEHMSDTQKVMTVGA